MDHAGMPQVGAPRELLAAYVTALEDASSLSALVSVVTHRRKPTVWERSIAGALRMAC